MTTERPTKSRKPRGPRPGKEDTREAVLAAAREQFSVSGYDGATIRGIATAAGVDPALVHHYFGNKEALFRAALEFPIDPAALVAQISTGDINTAAERLLRILIAVWDNPATGRPMMAIIRSATTSEMGAAMLREFLTREVIKRVAAELSPDRAEFRISLMGSQLAGLVLARYIVKLPPLATADPEAVIAAVAPNLQRYLTGTIA